MQNVMRIINRMHAVCLAARRRALHLLHDRSTRNIARSEEVQVFSLMQCPFYTARQSFQDKSVRYMHSCPRTGPRFVTHCA
jgi:hypothetical protein